MNKRLQFLEYQNHFDFWHQMSLDTNGAQTIVRQKHPSGDGNPGHFSHYTAEMDTAIAETIAKLSGNNDLAGFIIVCAAISLVQYKYNPADKFIFETPVFKPDVGPRSNNRTVPIVNEVKSDLTLKSLLAFLKERIRLSYAYQEYPADLLEDGGPKSNVLIKCPGLHSVCLHEKDYDLVIAVKGKAKGLSIDIQYRTSFFSSAFISNFHSHIGNALACFSDLTTLVRDISILHPDEAVRLANNFMPFRKTYPREQSTILEQFAKIVSRYPEKTAVVFEQNHLTYRELDHRSNALANHLIAKNEVKKGEVVGIMIERSELMIVSILGILKAGAAYCPIDPTYPESRIAFILDQAGINHLVTEALYLFAIPFYQGSILAVEVEQGIWEMPVTAPMPTVIPEDLAYVIFTSGSTGKPKGAKITHRGLNNLAVAQIKGFELTDSDRTLQFASISFDASVSEIFTTLLSAGVLVIPRQEELLEINRCMAFLQNLAISVVTLPPSYLALLDYAKLGFLRALITAGEPINARVATAICKTCNYINAYGPTEATVCATLFKMEGEPVLEEIPIGAPLENVNVYVLNTNQELVPCGVEGELFIGGPGIAQGYVGEDELTSERFVMSPFQQNEKLYRSGDFAVWNENGTLSFRGRRDDQIKLNGHRIELLEIKNALDLHPAIQNSFVSALHQDGRIIVRAYFIAAVEITADALTEWLSRRIPSYMYPHYFVRVDEFALTINGKIDVDRLPGQLEKNERSNFESDFERKVASLWAAALGVKSVYRDDNFYTLGGDSIKAIRLVSAVNEAFQGTLEIRDIFQYPEVKTFAAFIQAKATGDREDDLPCQIAKSRIDELVGQLLLDDTARSELPATFEACYPMSVIQKGMVYHSLLNPGQYHCQIYIEISDVEFQLDLFHNALRQMIGKHEMLRSSFCLFDREDSLVVVQPADSFSIPLKTYNLCGQTDDHVHEAIQRTIDEDQQQGFAYSIAPLWRIYLFEMDRSQGMLWVFHHAIMDGWSEASFMAELNDIYARLKEDHQYKTEPIRASYKDFVVAERMIESSPDILEFWRQRVGRASNAALPFQRAVKNIEKKDQGAHIFSLDDMLCNELVALSKIEKSNLKLITLSAFVYLLHVTTGSAVVNVGYVTNSRPDIADGEKILGCFLNTVPYVTTVPSNVNGTTLLRKVKEEIENLKRFDKLPFSKIKEIAKSEGNQEEQLYHVIFNYTQFHVLTDTLPVYEMVGTDYEIVTTANSALDMNIKHATPNGKDSIVVEMNYSDQYFSKADIETLSTYFVNILKAFVKDGDGDLRPLTLVNKAEGEHKGQAFSPKTSLLQGLTDWAVRRPFATAITFQDRVLTYAELDKMSTAVANGLVHLYQVSKNDVVALDIERSEKMLITILAILKTGATFLPVTPEYPDDRKKGILKDSHPKLIIVDKTPQDNTFGNVLLDDVFLRSLSWSGSHERIERDNLGPAYVLYTSGSTGNPKGVVIDRDALNNSLNAVQEILALQENDKTLAAATYSFDIAYLELFLPLMTGGQIVLAQSTVVKDADQFTELLTRECLDLIQLTPTYWSILLDTGWKPNSRHRILSGGEALPLNIARRLAQSAAKTVNLYGPTESTIWASAFEIKPDVDTVCIGTPLANATMLILDADLKELPPLVPGGIFIGGQSLALGYLNNPQLTSERFIDIRGQRYYNTGDTGRMDLDGQLLFEGRGDRQIKLRGHRIELSEIENHLMTMPHLKEVIVLPVFNDQGKVTGVAAYYVSVASIARREFIEHLKVRVPSIMIPTFFHHLSEMPLTSNGKVDKRALASRVQAKVDTSSPAGDEDRALADLFKAVLGVQVLNAADNFFELGGHSITAIQLIARIQKKFDDVIGIGDLMAHPSVAALSKFLATRQKRKRKPISAHGSDARYHPLSSSQYRIWVMSKYQNGLAIFNCPKVNVLNRPVDLAALQAALDLVFERHESLRTSFVTIDAVPYQYVNAAESTEHLIRFTNLENHSDRITALNSIVTGETTMPFDFEKAPLFRMHLVKVEENCNVLICTMHHLITDEFSLQIFFRQLKEAYDAILESRSPVFPRSNIQYKDYVYWMQEKLAKEHEDDKAFWSTILQPPLPTLNFDTDFARPKIQTFAGASINFKLPPALSESISKFTKTKRSTFFVTILTVIDILLERYTGQDDVVVGTALSGRSELELEDQIGSFINVVPLRNQVKKECTFLENFENVQSNFAKVLSHQDYPFERIAELVKGQRDASRNPLFDIVVTTEVVEDESFFQEPDFRNPSVEGMNKTALFSKHDMLIGFTQSPGDTYGYFFYNTALFKESRIVLFKDRLIALLTLLMKNHEVVIDTISLDQLTAENKKSKIIPSFNLQNRA